MIRKPVTAPPPSLSAVDSTLISTVLGLLLFGLVMVYSASIGMLDTPSPFGNTHFLLRHAFSIALGFSAGVFVFSVQLQSWQTLAKWLFLFGLLSLFLVLIPGVGKVVYGARRWVALPGISLQPSELMKLFVVLYAADYTVRKQDTMPDFWKGFLPIGCAVATVGLLLLLEPDMGAFVVVAIIAMGLLFIGRVDVRLFVGMVAIASATFSMLIWLSPWRKQRIFAYLAPFDEANALGKGYQLSHSLIAFGRGELFGVGLGRSIEKLRYLPEAHTDFLLAVVGEELGLVGVLSVIGAFAWLVYRAFQIGLQSVRLDQIFSGLVAQGIGLWLGFQSFINIGVNMGLLPTKGLTLPFVSYGGTGILVNCVAVGILLRIDYDNRQLTQKTLRFAT